MGSIRTTPAGHLYFDFRYRGVRCREYTTLRHSMTNLATLEQQLVAIEAQIALGTFDYRAHFPLGRRAALFHATRSARPQHARRVEYLTTEELSRHIKFDSRYIRERLKGRILVEGVHYIRPFGRKVLFIWETVEQLMHSRTPTGDGTARRKGSKAPRPASAPTKSG